jgi:hypothetical protein
VITINLTSARADVLGGELPTGTTLFSALIGVNDCGLPVNLTYPHAGVLDRELSSAFAGVHDGGLPVKLTSARADEIDH